MRGSPSGPENRPRRRIRRSDSEQGFHGGPFVPGALPLGGAPAGSRFERPAHQVQG